MSLLSASLSFGPSAQRLDQSQPRMAPMPGIPSSTSESALKGVTPPQGPAPWFAGSEELPKDRGRSFRQLDQRVRDIVRQSATERYRTPGRMERMPQVASRISAQALRNITPPPGPSPFSVSHYQLPNLPDGARSADASTRQLAAKAFQATMGKKAGGQVSAVA